MNTTDETKPACLFCPPHEDLILKQTEFAYLIVNKFPFGEVSFLIVFKRHIVDAFELFPEEIIDARRLVQTCSEKLPLKDFYVKENFGGAKTQEHVHWQINPYMEPVVPEPRRPEITKEKIEEIKTLWEK